MPPRSYLALPMGNPAANLARFLVRTSRRAKLLCFVSAPLFIFDAKRVSDHFVRINVTRFYYSTYMPIVFCLAVSCER